MKILVIGHSYLTIFAQESKYVAMKQLDPTLELCIVTPPEFHHTFKCYKHEVSPKLSSEEVIPLKTYLNTSISTYFHTPIDFAKLIRKFNPDHIHIEEDPHSIIGIETVLLSRIFCKRAKISFFIWDNLARKPKFPLNIIKKNLTNFSFQYTKLVVCGNTEGEKLLKQVKNYYGKSTVLPQVGLKVEDYESLPSEKVLATLQKKSDEPLIGFIGRLVPEKGIILLIESLLKIQHVSWKLLIVGSGSLKDEITLKWKPILKERLITLDAVSHQDVPDYLKCLDIFVLPSYSTPTWKEQFGLTLAQAMMAGVACIGSSSGAIPDVIGPGGLVFEEGNIESLTSNLLTLIESSKKRAEFGEKGKEFAYSKYTTTAVAQAYLNLFQK
jgi:L-malate glycosyltransferase